MKCLGGLTRCAMLLLTILLSACGQDETTATAAYEVESFLAGHWPDPLPAQGEPPQHYSPLEASLAPQSCAQCHQAQWEQWRGSLHSHTMGAGIQWQLRLMGQEQGNKCLRCHAPLAEQKALVALQQGWPAVPKSAPPAHVPPDLAEQGLACAACHVRGHQRFGPPARKMLTEEKLPHGGFTAAAAFEDSRFCATCHQFPQEGPRVNGKLQEDTYTQWQSSPFANKQSCQACHMPERQHLFRGVHDPEMVRKALQVTLETLPGENGRATARAVIRNSGAGHHFPTYMVPKVAVVLALVDRRTGAGKPLAQRTIGWGVNVALTEEQFDTRIPSGGELVITQPFELPVQGLWDLELRIEVAPREHYERMFQESLAKAGGRVDAETIALLKQALAEAVATRYQALRVTAPLTK